VHRQSFVQPAGILKVSNKGGRQQLLSLASFPYRDKMFANKQGNLVESIIIPEGQRFFVSPRR
jgi:hypothetical protein